MPTSTELRQQADVAEAEEKEAARLADEKRKEEERKETSWRLHAGDEARKLAKQVDAVLATRVTGRPPLEARPFARGVLYGRGPSLVEGLGVLATLDERLRQLWEADQSVRKAQGDVASHADEPLNNTLDDLECRVWVAVARRMRVCAGEAE
jgi:hypothetical protein